MHTFVADSAGGSAHAEKLSSAIDSVLECEVIACRSDISNPFADVRIDTLIAISDTASAEHLSPDAIDVVGADCVGKDGMEIVDSGR